MKSKRLKNEKREESNDVAGENSQDREGDRERERFSQLVICVSDSTIIIITNIEREIERF